MSIIDRYTKPWGDALRRNPGLQPLLEMAPYIYTTLLLVAVLIFADKMWATDDDPGMAMVVEGYGAVAGPSPALVFSNVAWGWLLMRLPHFSFIEPYLLVSYLLLAASYVAVMASLHRLRVSAPLAAVATLVMYGMAIIHPQFTILSGYLAAAGFLLLYAWRDSDSLLSLAASGILLLMSGLIRSGEFPLVTFVSLPLLFALFFKTKDWRKRRAWLVLALIVGALFGLSVLLDYSYYSSPAWAAFNGMDDIRVDFTDFHLGRYYAEHAAALQSTILTPNDISLISHWFESDPRIFNPHNFGPLTTSAPVAERIVSNFEFWDRLLDLVINSQFLMLIGLTLLVAVLTRGNRIALLASLLALEACMVALFLIGRAGIARVYIPAASAILLLGLATHSIDAGRKRLAYGLGLVLLVLWSVSLTQAWIKSYHDGRVRRSQDLIIAEFCELPHHDLMLLWGTMYFQWGTLYDQSRGAAQGCNMHVYSLDSLQLAPYSVENLYRSTGYGNVVDALLNGRTLYMYSQPSRLTLLSTYLKQHYGSSMSYRVVATAFKSLHIYAVQASPATMHPAGPGP